jgi:phosphate transport system substrate-binding protein
MPGSPFPSQRHQDFLTIRISKLTVVNGVLAVIVVVALVALGFRERAKSQIALAGDAVALHPHEPAAVSPPPLSGRPQRAGAETIAAQPAESKRFESEPADPLPPVESQPPNGEAVDSEVPRPPEVLVAELRPRQIIYREPLATDSAAVQPEVKPEDPPQPAEQPNQPAAPTPPTPNPPPPRPAPSSSATILNGAGATYPYPLYSKWFDDYHKLNPGVQINYQSVGSGAGVRELLNGEVDFGATDVLTSDEQLSRTKTPIVHIPAVLGAIVPVYNIPGVSREISFTPEILAGIYMGKIVSWNDAAIANVNRDVNLPDLPIAVIHRAEGNAATFVFTDYLSKVSRDWQEKVGKGTSVNWPIGLGAKGNEGVAGLIRQTPGAIGYVDLLYVEQNRMPFGSVSNAAGRFAKASLHSVTEAAASVTELPPNSGISITNAPGKDAYPIASFTWFLVPRKLQDPGKAQDLATFLRWTTTKGQPVAENLGYAPLPDRIVAQVLKIIAQLR